MKGGVINGGDFNWDFIFVPVTQVDMEAEESRGESGSAILKDPGPSLPGLAGMTFTKEKTGTVIVLDETTVLGEAAIGFKELLMELAMADLWDFSVP